MMVILQILLSLAILKLSSSSECCQNECHPLVSDVPDNALTASSSYASTVDHSPKNARLHTAENAHKGHNGIWTGHAGSWVAQNRRPGEWLQVRFKKKKAICKVQTRGRNSGNNQFVTKYKVSSSQDCKRFDDYTEHGSIKIFRGNIDRDAIVTHTLVNTVKALCFRITVLAFHSQPSMRFELIGHGEPWCPAGYTEWQKSCYKLIQENTSWMAAHSYCKWRGGDLVTVDSKAENDWIVSFLRKSDTHFKSMKFKDCSGKYTYIGKEIGNKCQRFKYHCWKMPHCTAVVTSRTTNTCWAHAGCMETDLTSSNSRDTTLLTARTSNIWMNPNRLEDDGHWETKPGQRASYFYWAHGEPKNGVAHHCASMSPTHQYRWVSQPCSHRFYFICEI